MRSTVVLAALILTLTACQSATPSDSAADSSSSSSIPAMASNSSSEATSSAGVTLLSGKHTVVLKTSKGNITLELDADMAPKTVTNFVEHAKEKYYDGLTFHRVIPGFMIQGGDPSGNGTGGESIFGETFEDEIDPSNSVYSGGYKTGAIAMANRGPDTNGSQFFIMEKDYPLPPSYTIFGRVTKGQDVVTKIANTERNPSNDMPTQKVTFSVEVVK